MHKLSGATAGVLLAWTFAATTMGTALAQTSPSSSPPSDADCNVIIGGLGVNDGRTVFPQGASFRVEGDLGCATPNGTVRVDAESDRFTFTNGTFRANDDGSYRSPPLTLPDHLALGPHLIVTVAQGADEYVSPILIFESEIDPTAPSEQAGGTDDSVSNTAVNTTAGGQVSLPDTGGDVLRLVLWAMAFMAGGSAFVLGAHRRGWRWHGIRFTGVRLKRGRPSAPLALPHPDIPLIDTRGFVPMRPRAEPRPPEAVTEADLLDQRTTEGRSPDV